MLLHHSARFLPAVLLVSGLLLGDRLNAAEEVAVCCFHGLDTPLVGAVQVTSVASVVPQAANLPIATPPAFHSRPGATRALYLDFNGQLVTGTVWNSTAGGEPAGSCEASNDCLPFDMDGDPTTFNAAEQETIRQVWLRVSEAYAPWEVDVTTVEPTSGLWMSCLFTPKLDRLGKANPYTSTALGVAQTAGFGNPLRRPAFCYFNSPANTANERIMANIAKHELGHTFGLKHDSNVAKGLNGYYPGHNGTSALTSWVPIMGEPVQSTRQMVQWSRGDFTGYVGNPAQGEMDDLLKIDNFLLRRADDHGGTVAQATVLPVSADGILNATGILSDTADVDVVRFTSPGTGPTSIAVTPLTDSATPGCGMLDVRFDLVRVADNTVITSVKPQGDPKAILANIPLEAGVEYALLISGDGEGNPFAATPTGYTSYGSLGQWTLNATLPAAPALTAIERFVTRFYEQCLGRSPDPGGLASWAADLAAGKRSGVEVARGFILSPEFTARSLADGAFTDVLYRSFFGREPDAGGQAGWQSELGRGVLREDVLYGFVLSGEFAALCQSAGLTPIDAPAQRSWTIRRFVRRFYQECLEREPDAAGITAWTDALVSGERLGGEVARGFALSPEFTQRGLSDQRYLAILYRAFFDREADAGGLAVWLNALQTGTDRATVLEGFIHAQEFRNLCTDAGILPFPAGG